MSNMPPPLLFVTFSVVNQFRAPSCDCLGSFSRKIYLSTRLSKQVPYSVTTAVQKTVCSSTWIFVVQSRSQTNSTTNLHVCLPCLFVFFLYNTFCNSSLTLTNIAVILMALKNITFRWGWWWRWCRWWRGIKWWWWWRGSWRWRYVNIMQIEFFTSQ